MGLVTTAAAAPAITSATARRIEATAAGALDAFGCDRDVERQDRQRRTKCRRRRRRHVDDWHVESKCRSPPRKKFGVADNIERWQVKLGASPPDPQREIGTDPGRLAER
jgi:hypothetical protein